MCFLIVGFSLSVCVVGTGDPGAGEPGGDVHHPGRGRLTAMHPGSVPSHHILYYCIINMWPGGCSDVLHCSSHHFNYKLVAHAYMMFVA